MKKNNECNDDGDDDDDDDGTCVVFNNIKITFVFCRAHETR